MFPLMPSAAISTKVHLSGFEANEYGSRTSRPLVVTSGLDESVAVVVLSVEALNKCRWT